MCLRKCKLCKSNVKTNVFEGFANWMLLDGNQQKYFKKYIKVLEQLMTNPCKIDARKRNAKNMENDTNMAPTWRSKFIKKHEKTIQKHITKNDAKMKRQKAIRSEGPGGVLGPGVPEEVRSSSGDSRSRFPLASNIITKTNTRQTIKKQCPRTSGSTSHALDVLAGTVRTY